MIGVLALALPAAILSGHNVLFFVTGLLLALSGLSRLFAAVAIRWLRLEAAAAGALPPRVGVPSRLPLVLRHVGRHLPAYGIGGSLWLQGDRHRECVPLGFVTAVAPGGAVPLWPSWVPQHRGPLQPTYARLCSAAPFGLVEQARRLSLQGLPPLWCAPAHVDVGAAVRHVASRLGNAPLQQAGEGDEFFSLRPYRAGDDVRRVAWRRSARSGRLLVVEPEALLARDVLIHLQVDLRAGAPAVEHAIACACSLGEALLRDGFGVALHSHGVVVGLRRGVAGRGVLLRAFARLNPRQPLPALPRRFVALPQVGFVGPAVLPPGGGRLATLRLPLPHAASTAAAEAG